MLIDQLASIGTLIGAIATVITLLYLATQIKQNTVAFRSASITTYVQAIGSLTNMLAQDPELADVYYGGLRDPQALDEAERQRFILVLGNYMMYLAQAEQMQSEGSLPPGFAHQYNVQLDWLVCQPGFLYWREHWGDLLPPEFAIKVEASIKRSAAQGRVGVFTADRREWEKIPDNN